MLDLQYQEQTLSHREYTDLEQNEGNVDLSTQGTLGWGKRTATETVGLDTLAGSEPPIQKVMAPRTSAVNGDFPRGPPSPPVQQGVGRGTLYFSDDYQNNYRGDNSLEANRLNPAQQEYATYGALPDQQHEFHYGNPDYHDPYDHPNGQYNDSEESCCAKFCCLFQPLVNLLSMEQLQRSFCFGAIDGMLTGSGIVSAFCGLGVLNSDAPWEVRLAVVAFSAAACFADSLCMAIGHIWTSYVVSSHHAEERSRERLLLDVNKADAKGKMVDMFLARGMLKIDAMSLADTLEGYPDLFVSTLVGDSLLGGVEGPDDDDDSQTYGGNVVRKASGGSRSGAFGSWRLPSYGQFNELDQDPEAGNVTLVVRESQREGFFMMAGFASFAIVPSLLWLYLPLMDPADHQEGFQKDTMSLPSLVITVLAIIMWTLGVWKSHFLESNWVIFGVETVVVLLICVMSAYGVGSALSRTLAEGMAASNLTAIHMIID